MKRACFLAALALVHAAQAAPYHPTLSGEQFVALLAQEPKDAFGYHQRERAYAYVDGVQDAVAGAAWCAPVPVKTDELAYNAAGYIKRLPADRRKGNAAPLVAAYLASIRQCKGVPQ